MKRCEDLHMVPQHYACGPLELLVMFNCCHLLCFRMPTLREWSHWLPSKWPDQPKTINLKLWQVNGSLFSGLIMKVPLRLTRSSLCFSVDDVVKMWQHQCFMSVLHVSESATCLNTGQRSQVMWLCSSWYRQNPTNWPASGPEEVLDVMLSPQWCEDVGSEHCRSISEISWCLVGVASVPGHTVRNTESLNWKGTNPKCMPRSTRTRSGCTKVNRWEWMQ